MRFFINSLLILTALHSPPRPPSFVPPPSTFLSANMSTDATQPSTAVSPEWLQDRLQTLLNSPYIHFNQPKLPHIRMGHGPVDLFSTRFNNWFTNDATGVVAGNTVDKAGLKEALLALQRKWNNDTARFTPATSVQEGSVCLLVCAPNYYLTPCLRSWLRAASSPRSGRSSRRTSLPLPREYHEIRWQHMTCSSPRPF